ncbi:hypothetical protein KM176_24495, partial [Pseudooceanicola sp. CBS1P-1]
GAPVTYLPQGGSARVVQSVFRRMPVDATDPDGHPVLVTSPSWSVPRDLVPELRRGDQIRPGDGLTYEVQNVWPSGSPATDARLICELFEVFS